MGQESSSSDPSVDNHPYWSHLPKKYRFVNILGEGSYGKVLRCQEKDSKRFVAIKIPKQFQNDQEASILKMLMEHKFDQHNIVKFHDSFNTVFGKAMVFETLDMSLLEYISGFRLLPMKLSEVRTIVQQVATALDALKSVGIIHGDLKLNNIMLVDRVRKHLELKVIDFGLAMKTSKMKKGKQMQVLAYRAPEVILGLPLSEAIDMWTLGNLMFNLVTGGMLHAATCEYDAISIIVRYFGHPADHLLENGLYTMKYFNKTESNSWRIKTRKEYFGPVFKEKYRHVTIRTLDDWKSMGSHANSVERDQCFELLEAMLKLDPNERIAPSEVLKHPFITNSFNSNRASGSAQKKPSVCPPPSQWEEKEKIVPKHPFYRNYASGYAQKKRYVCPPSPQWSTPSDTDSYMIFNFGTNSPRSQPSPSIHKSLNCKPPATAVTDDANDNIQPDHQSPSPAVQPSGVKMVHPVTDLGSQDYHRSLCKIKVGPAAPENTSELEDEESSVRIFYIGSISPRSQPSLSIYESLSCENPATAVTADANDNIKPDHQSPCPTVQPSGVMMVHPAADLGSQDYRRSLLNIKVGSELEDEESSVSLEAHKDKMATTQPSTSTKEFFNSGLPATALNTANIQPDCQKSLYKIKVGPAAPENTPESEDEESSVSLQAGLDSILESIAEVKESDKMEIKDKSKKKKKRRRKNRVQRIFAWMRKTFSFLSRNRDVIDSEDEAL